MLRSVQPVAVEELHSLAAMHLPQAEAVVNQDKALALVVVAVELALAAVSLAGVCPVRVAERLETTTLVLAEVPS
jgi:hypothetical protein